MSGKLGMKLAIGESIFLGALRIKKQQQIGITARPPFGHYSIVNKITVQSVRE